MTEPLDDNALTRLRHTEAAQTNGTAIQGLIVRLDAAEAERDKLRRFKSWVHGFLDARGVPHHPPGTHGAEGCRVGDRMDWLTARLDAAQVERDALRAALRELRDAVEGLDGPPEPSGRRYARALLEAGRLLGEGR